MAPVIGITTQTIRRAKWYKQVRDLGFQAIEINRRNSKLHLNLYFLEKVKRYVEGLDLSLHTGTSGIFQTHESFTQANLAILAAEVGVCRVLGAEQLILHLNDGFLSPENKRRLREVFCYAWDSGVDVLYESNSILVADYAYDVLESFPELGYVLDLGHLNTGRGTGRLGCDMEEFIRQVRERTVYVHASNNSGQCDEHCGLENGTLDWRRVLDMLDLSKIKKIIIEVRYMEMVDNSRKELRRYLGGDLPAQRYYVVGSRF